MTAKPKVSDEQSKIIWAAKAVAILSVFCAHMSSVNSDLSAIGVAERMLSSFGQVGVIAFFFFAGFFYHREKGDSKTFWVKKTKNIIIPYIIIATLTFAASVLIRSKYSGILVSYIKWILGSGSWYYFVSVLLVMFVIFKFCNSDFWLYLFMALNVISILMSQFGIIKYGENLTAYLNVFNWIGFFSLGVLVNKKGLIKFLLSKTSVIICSVVFVALFIWAAYNNVYIQSYFYLLSIPFELSAVVVLLFISKLLCRSSLICDIGKKSYAIYLIHMQIAGAISSRIGGNIFLILIKPIVALMLVYFILKAFEIICKKIGLPKLPQYIGVKS